MNRKYSVLFTIVSSFRECTPLHMRHKKIPLVAAVFLYICINSAFFTQLYADSPAFVRREGTHFMVGDQRLYYMGASCYYLAYWGADTTTNELTGLTYREESLAYLLRCRDLGFNVVRIWAFNDGDDIRALQPSPGVHREEALRGYDYILDRGSELGLRFVLTLVNNWDDYGGMNWYVSHSPTAQVHADFYTDPQCRAWYRAHIDTMLNRTNSFNGKVYREDPAIFSWQLANEPRWDSFPEDSDPVDTTGGIIRDWIWESASYIKGIDTNHMVSTGEEGWGADQSWEGTRWSLNNASPDIDYTVIHCWPDWWEGLWGEEPALYSNAMVWVESHLQVSEQLNKPMVLSEYGKSRPLEGDGGRHYYYQGFFDAMYLSAISGGPAGGLHFWMLEADGSTHDDGFSVFPSETNTLALLSGHASLMNSIISPEITAFGNLFSGELFLNWTPVTGSPLFEVQESYDRSNWNVIARVATNQWIGTGGAGRGFYRIRPYWP